MRSSESLVDGQAYRLGRALFLLKGRFLALVPGDIFRSDLLQPARSVCVSFERFFIFL